MTATSVVILTKNEAKTIQSCLENLTQFDDVWVVDSLSRDGTGGIVRNQKIQIVEFEWNGHYPKKRQWCLDNLPLKYDWVFFVDADEIIPASLIAEIQNTLSLSPSEAGFFVTGRYRIKEKILRFGIPNKKIALFHRERMQFPVVNDLDIPGMGEIEGHYQPVFKPNNTNFKIGHFRNYMIHDALSDERAWNFRHEKYARWESGMNQKGVWPKDPVKWRDTVKQFLRTSRFRPEIIFLIGFIFKLGFLDGAEGLKYAKLKHEYYRKVKN